MKWDTSGRPYVASPLMAQYFAGHLQTHYKRVVMGYVGLGAGVLLLGGVAIRGCDTSAPSVGVSAETNATIWRFLESVPVIGGLESRLHGPHYSEPTVYPEDPARADDPLYQHIPTTTAAAHTDESGGESDDSDFYTCTPGTRWCTP